MLFKSVILQVFFSLHLHISVFVGVCLTGSSSGTLLLWQDFKVRTYILCVAKVEQINEFIVD